MFNVFRQLPCLFRPPFLPRAQKVVSVDDGNALSVVDPTAFTAALALERNGQEKVTRTWFTFNVTHEKIQQRPEIEVQIL